MKICIVCLEDQDLNQQMIGKAKTLGKDFRTLALVLQTKDFDNNLIKKYNADEIYFVRIEGGMEQLNISEIVKNFNKEQEVELYMFPATGQGREMASNAAITLGCGLVAECIDIKYEDGFIFKRTTNSDSMMAEIICCNSRISMCTVRKNIFEPSKKTTQGVLPVIHKSAYINTQFMKGREIMRRIIDRQNKESLNLNSHIIIGIGRGCLNQKLLEKVKKLAKHLNAQIVGTRAVVDADMLGYERQVGQSGKSVSPDIYLALGISGAIQHIVGMDKSKLIIAVNRDKNAPIFNYADYAIIEDCDLVVSEMLNELETLVIQ